MDPLFVARFALIFSVVCLIINIISLLSRKKMSSSKWDRPDVEITNDLVYGNLSRTVSDSTREDEDRCDAD